jgi:hypothetical protein
VSDFLFCSQPRAAGELEMVLRRYLSPVTATVVERHGPWGSLAVLRGLHDPPRVLVEEGGSISVLIGDPVVRTGAEPAARSSIGARREAVHTLLRDGATPWFERIDSGFAALDIGPDGGRVVTDVAAFVPVFTADVDRGVVIGTHLDAVARAAGKNRDIDPVSAADMLINLSCTWPHTLYRGVRQLAPASVREFGADGNWMDEGAVYWRPTEHNPYRNVDEAAAALRTAVTDDVRAAVHGEPVAGLLLSGGEDARAVLGAVPDGVEVRAFVYADWENREVRVARATARAYGASLTFGQRTRDHYVDGLGPVSSIIGAHNNFMDVHGWGLHERLGIRELPIVLGGLSSDSFLKAEHAPSVAPSDSFDLPASSAIRPELREAVIARRLEFRRWLAEMRPTTAAEWERLWPFTQRRHSANLHGNRRLFASHEVYHANAVVAIAAAVPAAWKQHRRLFHLAMKPLFRRSWHVPHARWRFPYFGAAANLPLSAGLRVTRGIRALLTGEVRARQQPWPKWRVVARSEAAARAMAARPPWETPLRAIFVEKTAEELAASIRTEWHPLRELFLLQLAFLATEAERP